VLSFRALAAGRTELALRVCSALLLVPLAVATAYAGGWAFVVLWTIAAIVAFWEWSSLVTGPTASAAASPAACQFVILDRFVVLCAMLIAIAAILVALGHALAAFTALAAAMLIAWAAAPRGRGFWLAAGVPYAAAMAVAPIVLRSDTQYGFYVIILLFAIVWATDTVAYFVGRAIGGPKLMPRVSPNKTWSGALSGTAAAIAVALLLAWGAGLRDVLAIGAVALMLSVLAQAGDLLESFLKRRFGAKDSGHLIPGHGGLMDRLDGFVAAGFLAAVIGVARAGWAMPGSGLLVW
jgi:phosphatidate cytidylyltransferase